VPQTQARVAVVAQSLWALAQTGIVRPYGPKVLFRIARTLVQWGTGPAGGYTALAARLPDAVGVEDERGSVTFDEIHRHSNALARGLESMGVAEGDRVAILCRNHRGFVEASVGVAKLGADLLYLNTAFSAPQLVEVLVREQPLAIVLDEEFLPLVEDVPAQVHRVVAWSDAPEGPAADALTLDRLVAEHDDADVRVPEREARSVILTSGTTGAPKGASRGSGSLDAAASLVSRLPLRHGMRVHVAAPLFHTWGWAHFNLSMLIGSTLVLRRRFEPEEFLATLADRVDAAVVIPVMLQRVLQLPAEVLERHDLSHVRVVAASGSALPGDLATAWMDRFGDHLYNTYGSTECAWATIAEPAELRAHPGTAGRAPIGTVVRVLDDRGEPVTHGSGRIFVGNSLLFEGYTEGGSKDVVDGLMATGDVGRFEDGLLFVEGRDDEMIVSGGENVYPQEVEDCLARHADVVEVAVIGVDDDEFGQRLRAFVVLRDGATADEDALKGWVKERLARYKVPREVVVVPELPRNATGKVLKRELREASSGEGPA
jgi:acyl-CoA synthetase (AMP-forming)/AMP-acid ligase II